MADDPHDLMDADPATDPEAVTRTGVTPGVEHAGSRRSAVFSALWRGFLLVAVLLLAEGVALLIVSGPAGRSAREGRARLVEAEQHVGARRLPEARNALDAADAAFARTERSVDRIGPFRAVIAVTPVMRVQLRAVETFARSGRGLAHAGRDMVTTVERIESAGADAGDDTAGHVGALSEAVDRAAARMATAEGAVDDLRRYRLVPPLAAARDELSQELPGARDRIQDLSDSLAAIRFFLGMPDSKRFLVLTQNPDEARPLGGYIGTYGVLSADNGQISLERYAPIEDWYNANFAAVVPTAERDTPFRLLGGKASDQNIANVNASADWYRSAELATELWTRGGEAPVDGVISLTPEVLARVVGAVGPVEVPGYAETVTAENLVEKVDFYTHFDPLREERAGGRKQFLAELAEVVLGRVFTVSVGELEAVARALADGLNARESMLWSRDSRTLQTIASHGWDGVVAAPDGDMVFPAEFAFTSKVSREVTRHFRHTVVLAEDGSAEVTTVARLTNTAPFHGVDNRDGRVYLTMYGPRGARLAGSSSRPTAVEPSLHGHPGAGYLVIAEPGGGTAEVTVTWTVPAMTSAHPGHRTYELRWFRAVGRSSTVELDVRPPEGWQWAGGAGPPPQLTLDGDFHGEWRLESGR